MGLDKLAAENVTVLVPAGAEYKAVKRGVKHAQHSLDIVAVPAGKAVKEFVIELKKEKRIRENVLMMGLGGGLCAESAVGRSRLLKQVWSADDGSNLWTNDRLTMQIAAQLEDVSYGAGVMCNQVVTKAIDKKALGDRYQAQVVDMESFSLLQALPQHKVAILRVISDSCEHDIPNVTDAIRADGSLNAAALTLSFAQKPIAAIRFISSSLKGLNQLEKVAERLFP